MDGRVSEIIDHGVSSESLPSPRAVKASGTVAIGAAVTQLGEAFTEWGDSHGVSVEAERIPDPRSPHGYTTHPTGW